MNQESIEVNYDHSKFKDAKIKTKSIRKEDFPIILVIVLLLFINMLVGYFYATKKKVLSDEYTIEVARVSYEIGYHEAIQIIVDSSRVPTYEDFKKDSIEFEKLLN